MEAKIGAQNRKSRSGQRFGEDVSKLFVRKDMDYIQITQLNFLLQEVMFKFNVLRMGMQNRICSKVCCAKIITIDVNRVL